MDSAHKYTAAQKAVAALVAIGKPNATSLLKMLTREEISNLIAASKTMKTVTQNGLVLIAGEFEAEFTKGAGLIDSSGQMDAILGASFDETELAALTTKDQIPPASVPSSKSVWDILSQTDAPILARYFEAENVQVGAFALAHLHPSQAAEVISELEQNARIRILAGMLSVGKASVDAEKMLEDELFEQFGQSNKSSEKSAFTNVASILNELEKDTSESLLTSLSISVDASVVSSVRSMLFRFDDIAFLELTARTAIFDALPTETITMALRDADADLTESILSAISQRTRRMIEGDLKSKAQFRVSDISVARKRIVNEVLKLASEGRITLARGEQEAA